MSKENKKKNINGMQRSRIIKGEMKNMNKKLNFQTILI